MTTVSTQKETVIVTPYSGDYRIDVLLPSATARWNNGSPVGTAVEVSFSFMNAAPGYAQDSDKKGFSVFTDEQKVATRKILDQISQQFGISFKEVSDTADSYGYIRFGNNAQGSTSAGYATYPDTSDTKTSGDVYINNEASDNLSNIVPGSGAWSTLVHEIGHALGLKHPGNYNAGEPASSAPDNFLAAAEDNAINTVMSYISAPQGQERDFFGKYDYLALQYLYGSKTYNAGDTTYNFTDADGRVLKVINDTGGVDTLNMSALTMAANINLNPGANSSVGRLASDTASINNVSIAYGTVIENVIGTRFSDVMTGNNANNRFESNGGGDTVDGGAGFDVLLIKENRAAFTIKKGSSDVKFINNSTNDVTSVINVERVQLNDKVVAFDFDGVAGQAYRLYQAAFDRKPDAAGLGYWIADMDKGSSLSTVAAGFFQSAEFQKLYGANPSTTTLITNFYQNVLHRAPDQAGFDYWNKELSSGVSTPQTALASFCESVENKAQVLAAIQDGIEYTMWLG
ncbi:DUF4214 domain-containing protein [Undibacterium sp. TS12]|uniref:DUF4214 domain-containing protein n=1 Tax=Undibacterium sp. TS12 TaxID=2908202 RepID=UPI001F4C662E|nr:DUF4214 domain-containing protein [Undibacterium sp. TS12]MCH8618319.1 DUF4214 domain-containing protein [Undibacterium sp. TS12]